MWYLTPIFKGINQQEIAFKYLGDMFKYVDEHDIQHFSCKYVKSN